MKTKTPETPKTLPPVAVPKNGDPLAIGPLKLAPLPSLEKQQVQHINPDKIQPSPFQPRKEFVPEEMEALQESIRANGIRIPLLGRPTRGNGKELELVAGERRLRCALKLNLAAVPIIIQDLTDAEVIRIQRLENGARENLKALEAAEDYVLLEKQGKSIEEICTLYGVKRSHVFTRKRVAKLPDKIKAQIREGKLPITVADLIAKLPNEGTMAKAVKEIDEERRYGDGDEVSVRRAKEILQDKFQCDLSKAPFDVKATYAIGKGLHGDPCEHCIHRTGNAPALYPDAKPNVCTNLDCFNAKKAAHGQEVMMKARNEGKTVLDEKESKKVFPYGLHSTSHHYMRASDTCYQDPKNRTYRQLLGKDMPQPIVATHQGEAHEVFKRNDIEAALKKVGHKFGSSHRTNKPNKEQLARQEKYERESKAIEAAKTAAVLKASSELDAAGKKPLSMDFWRKLANTVLIREAEMGHIDEDLLTGRGMKPAEGGVEADQKQLQDYIQRQVTPHNLIGFIVHVQLDCNTSTHSPELLEVWGVDWKKYLAKQSKVEGRKPKAKTKTGRKGKAKK